MGNESYIPQWQQNRRWDGPWFKKCFVCERTYDKVESDRAMCFLTLKFVLILRQQTKILKKNKPYLTIYDIYLFSCGLVQFKVSLHWGFVMYQYRIGKKCVKELQQFIYSSRCTTVQSNTTPVAAVPTEWRKQARTCPVSRSMYSILAWRKTGHHN